MTELTIGSVWEPDPDGVVDGCMASCCRGLRRIIGFDEEGDVEYEVLNESGEWFPWETVDRREFLLMHVFVTKSSTKPKSGFGKFINKIECTEVSDG